MRCEVVEVLKSTWESYALTHFSITPPIFNKLELILRRRFLLTVVPHAWRADNRFVLHLANA